MSLLLVNGDAVQIPLADESVHCCVCSPPYWGLRDYGLDERGLGLESTPEAYVANMVAVFREVRRVLRSDGTVWLNMGDSYAMNFSGGKGRKAGTTDSQIDYQDKPPRIVAPGLKPKDLVGIPWRVAFALQADGWWLRSDIIWSKPNPMPESVTDRPTKAHEYLFLLTKSAKYFYDADAVREEYSDNRPWGKIGNVEKDYHGDLLNKRFDYSGSGRNRRTVWNIDDDLWTEFMQFLEWKDSNTDKPDVWNIATQPYSGSHFATFPVALVEPCIKAGTSERGVCPECGGQWERVVDSKHDWYRSPKRKLDKKITSNYMGNGQSRKVVTTLGWRPTCDHDHEPVPAVVFDPFAGSGTTLLVARALGRHGVGIDLSAEYLQLARERLSLDALEDWGVGKKDGKGELTDLPLFEEVT
jgi:DNA modification methylase